MASQATPQPVEIKKEAEGIRVTWQDGHRGFYPHRYLRAHCQCAACVEEWTGKVMVDADTIAPTIAPKEIRPVGRYAIHIEWNDGHTTGIYAFGLLRQLCPCQQCRPERAPMAARKE